MSITGIGSTRTLEQLRQGPATSREVASALGWTPRRAEQVMRLLVVERRVEQVMRLLVVERRVEPSGWRPSTRRRAVVWKLASPGASRRAVHESPAAVPPQPAGECGPEGTTR